MAANDIQIGGDHYLKYEEFQPFRVYEKWLGHEGLVGYLRGNIFSYLLRYKDKGGVEDLKKALHDLGRLIEVESAKIPDKGNSQPKKWCSCYDASITQERIPCPIHGEFKPGEYP